MYEDRHLPMLEWWLSDRLYILKDKPAAFGNPDYQMNSSSVQKLFMRYIFHLCNAGLCVRNMVV